MRNRTLKFLGLAGAATVLLIGPISIASAEDATDSPTPTLYSNDQVAPTNAQPNDDHGQPEHRIREEERGFEGIQLSIVAGSIIIAAGIAIGISRSRSAK